MWVEEPAEQGLLNEHREHRCTTQVKSSALHGAELGFRVSVIEAAAGCQAMGGYNGIIYAVVYVCTSRYIHA